jgi:glycosyltransferase involved in cell wall biosynthesis
VTRISIIVPSKDSGEFLLRTVRSVLDSGIHAEGLECIVVASDSDLSINLLPIEDPRLIIHRTTASGLSRLINAGIEQSSGEIIGILKSGDLYEPGALRNVLLQFGAQSQCDALYGQVNLIDTNDRFIRRLKIFTPTLRRLSTRPCLHSSAFFFRRRLIERIGAFDESVSYWPHYDFWIRIALAKVPFASTQTILACNRVHPVSQKAKTDREMQAAREALNLIRSRLGISSIRWAIHYGRSVAEKAGHSRTKSSTFDVVTLQSAIAELKLDAETNIERCLRLWSVVGQHGLSEINNFR